MPGRPELLDNLSDETRHAAALVFLATDDGTAGYPIAVATGYVNLGGLHQLAITVTDGRGVRLLLGAVPDPALGADLPIPRFELALRSLAGERDLARFPPSRAAEQLASIDSWLDDPSVLVRRYVQRFLHGKAYLFGTATDARAAMVSSANLTGGGLFANLELGVVDYNPSVAGAALRWFDGLWDQATEFKDALHALLFPDPGFVDPQTVYLRALLELYGEELDAAAADGPPISSVDLAPFQRDGFDRARAIVAAHGGVVYADGVGTGKTEIGLAFIEEYALRRGHHALVVTPAQLVENWRERIDRSLLPAQVVSYQELATDEQLNPTTVAHRARHLHNAKDSYRLVVIDEGHAFRNPDTTWYRALDRLLGGQPKDAVLLTATPINNGLWDLYHLVMAFVRHDRAFAKEGISSLHDLFRDAGANERDPENLDPDKLFPLADAISVRRDRRFIEEHYPGATFSDGTPVQFPEPHMHTARYDLDAAHPELVHEITDSIGQLSMARYRPSKYDLAAEEEVSERTLAGLLQSGILKRFESCWWACRNTIARMVAVHDAFLVAWDNEGVVASREALRAAASEELDDAGIAAWIAETVTDDAGSRPIVDFSPEFRADVTQDRERLVRIRDRLSELTPANDPKLSRLRALLETSSSQKVAVFATFGDTIRYLDDNLPPTVGGRDRVVVIGTESDPDTRAGSLARFCPQTVVRSDYVPPEGEVDLLLSTDVLSEGQNLQQAAAVISYDMPWNPQRVIQRNGRVIRLKSPHADVELTTMLPEPGELEDFLRLEATIRRKIVAAGVFGMETEVIEGIETELRAYAGRVEEGDTSLLDEDGEVTAAGGFSGEELRAELLRALREGEVERLRQLPWGTGAAFRQAPDVPSTGAPGVFFAFRTRSGERYWRFVEPSQQGWIVQETADILRRIDPGAAPGVPDPAGLVDLDDAWRRAVESVVAEHNRRADPRVDQERIGPIQRFALDLLRDPVLPLPAGAAEAEGALSVERGGAVRHALGDVRRQVTEGVLSREEAVQLIVEVVQRYGLRDVESPPPLDPITEDDVGVVCWMAVLAADRAKTR